ncbi:relaxin receptor 2-like [Sinocyclocheilus rhinocerous]|uniref:relaxin receptor 2-like n=1 Tax=Sinocyclocheilus rhinocerous TaxID=307959 RepID=UPI0007B9C516|nr:PREDICTED: relaxin receptor 2-like [Sinocyclocheilus rhinocerous]
MYGWHDATMRSVQSAAVTVFTSDLYLIWILLTISITTIKAGLERRPSEDCPLGHFPCGNMSICLPQVLHCNGQNDCPNGADEDSCGDNSGWADLFDRTFKRIYPQDLATDCQVEQYPDRCRCINTEIHCVHVSLRSIPQVSSNVTSLSLSQNCISLLSPGVFSDLHKLKWLILDDNPITTITANTFTGLSSLFFLSMVNTFLEQLPPARLCTHMPFLSWLDFEGNCIKTLGLSTLLGCEHLTVLSLRANLIKSLPENTFQSLRMMEDLDLSSNLIKELPVSIFKDLPSLQILNLSQFLHIGLSSFEDLLANVVLRVSVWVMAFITCFGNLFVIGMRTVLRAENNLHALCIKVLCCADCLMGVYLFFVGFFDVKFRGEYNKNAKLWMDSLECRIIGFLAMLSSEVSVMMLTYLTMEKFLVIVFPFSHLRPSKCQTFTVLTSIWLLGISIAAVPLLNEEMFGNYYGHNGVCFPLHSEGLEKPIAKGYSIGIFLGLNLVAFLIIGVSYSSMFYSIYKTGINATELRGRLHRDVAMAHRFFFIVFSDALCWIPIFLVKILSLLEVEIPGTITSWVVIFVLPINSALNPILYTLTTSFFREQVELLRCHWHRQPRLRQDRKSLTSSAIHTDPSRSSFCHHNYNPQTRADPPYTQNMQVA